MDNTLLVLTPPVAFIKRLRGLLLSGLTSLRELWRQHTLGQEQVYHG